MSSKLKIFSGSSNPDLASGIASHLRIPLGNIELLRFCDDEIWVKYKENIRGTDCFLVQSTNPPAENLLELLIMIDAARRASAYRITAVIPYFGYARQDRKDQPRVSVTAKLVANLLTKAGADRILTMDLHAPQIQGFFDIPVDHLYAASILNEYFKKIDIPNLVVASPDVGGIRLARAYARRLHVPLAVLDKRRPKPNEAKVMNLIGEVEGKNVLLIDDIVDTAGTMKEAIEFLSNNGALKVFAACTHPLLSGKAIEKLRNSKIEKLIVTDTIALPPEKKIKQIQVLSVARVFAQGIQSIHRNTSISKLFKIE